MDYTDILTSAWKVTWRYKILWLFGLFAGAGMAGGGGGSSSYRTQQPASTSLTNEMAIARTFIERYIGVILLVAVVLVLLALVFLVVGVAARGGIIHLVNEAEEGREVRATDGWRVGFRKWWRIFGVGLLAGLPGLALVFALAGVVAIGVVALIRRGGSTEGLTAAAGGLIAGGCCFLLVFVLLAIFVGVVFGIVAELALRYAVLEDRHVIEALKQGWHDLWGRRGAFLMYLIQFGIGIAYQFAIGVIALLIIGPGIVAGIAGAWGAGASLLGVGLLVLMLPAAIYSAFYSSVWTIFFRRMNGMAAAPSAVSARPIAPTPYPMAPAAAAPSAPEPTPAGPTLVPPSPAVAPDAAPEGQAPLDASGQTPEGQPHA